MRGFAVRCVTTPPRGPSVDDAAGDCRFAGLDDERRCITVCRSCAITPEHTPRTIEIVRPPRRPTSGWSSDRALVSSAHLTVGPCPWLVQRSNVRCQGYTRVMATRELWPCSYSLWFRDRLRTALRGDATVGTSRNTSVQSVRPFVREIRLSLRHMAVNLADRTTGCHVMSGRGAVA